MSRGIITLGRFAIAKTQIPLFDDTMCRVVSSPKGFSAPQRPKNQDFDDTMRRGVSSPWGFSGPQRPEIRVFDDTTCRIVSSLRAFSEPQRLKTRGLMILCHHPDCFRNRRDLEPGNSMIHRKCPAKGRAFRYSSIILPL